MVRGIMYRSMITSSIAFIIYTSVMFITYLLTIWFGQLPFLAFATQYSVAFVAYITKRLIARNKENENR